MYTAQDSVSTITEDKRHRPNVEYASITGLVESAVGFTEPQMHIVCVRFSEACFAVSEVKLPISKMRL